ncbi:hypothetical protein D7X48_13105 [bacterium D16-50]|nr:hypothetical protein D7X48_13105 [bacterium D16-50]
MRKLMAVELTKMRYYRAIWGVALFAFGISGAAAVSGRYEGAVTRYPILEYLLFFTLPAEPFVF